MTRQGIPDVVETTHHDRLALPNEFVEEHHHRHCNVDDSYKNQSSWIETEEQRNHHSSSLSPRHRRLCRTIMDFVSEEDSKIRAKRVLQEAKTLRTFAKILGVMCVGLVVCVFGVDVHLLEEMAAVVVHNVIAAVVVIVGLNLAVFAMDSVAEPSSGTSAPTTSLQGIYRRSSKGMLNAGTNNHKRRRTSLRGSPAPSSKQSSGFSFRKSTGNVLSGLWPSRSSKRSNKQQKERSNSTRKLSIGRRRGWHTGRRTTSSASTTTTI